MSLTASLLADASVSKASNNKPDGTAVAGYVTPDLGPFKCGNCIHFSSKKSKCDQPEVISDPKVKGIVEADGCCNYFKSRNKR